MVITLTQVASASEFEIATLRARADKAPHMETTRLFRAMAGSEEMGLVVLDVQAGAQCFILYEIFVCTPMRNRGIGSKLLAAVETYVSASGQTCLEVWPRSLDTRSRTDGQLVQWYRARGYLSTRSNAQRLRKTLTAAAVPPAR